jgi:hypothetical protein
LARGGKNIMGLMELCSAQLHTKSVIGNAACEEELQLTRIPELLKRCG